MDARNPSNSFGAGFNSEIDVSMNSLPSVDTIKNFVLTSYSPPEFLLKPLINFRFAKYTRRLLFDF